MNHPWPRLVFVLPALALAVSSTAQSLKLNGPLARGIVGEFSFPPQTSPDGRFHVYTADRDGDHAFELYSVSAGGTHAPRRLADVEEYANAQITRDSSGVLFVADQDGNGSYELALAPIDGSGPPVVLSGILGNYGSWFHQSRAGSRVVYVQGSLDLARRAPGPGDAPRAPKAGESRRPYPTAEIFSVPIDGGAPVKLNRPLVEGRVYQVALSSDDRVLYSASRGTNERIELFLAPIDGSAPAAKLPIPLVSGGNVVLFQFSPDGSRVFYEADQEEDERFEVFSIASDGSEPPRKLSGPLVPGGDVGVLVTSRPPCPQSGCVTTFYPGFRVSPDGQWVAYTANQDDIGRFELYSAPADGSRPAVKLSASPDRDVTIASLTYDSAWVIYQNDNRYPDEIFSAPIDGSAPARRLARVTGYAYPFLQVSFDSRYVVYQAAEEPERILELYSVPVDGSAEPVELSAPFPVGGQLGGGRFYPGFWVLPGGVAYQAEQELDGLPELYFVPAAGGVPPRKLASGPIAEIQASTVYSPPTWKLLDAILFLRGGALLSVGLDEAARPTLLDELSLGGVEGDVQAFVLAPDGERVVYAANEEGDSAPAVYSVPTDKPEERAGFFPGPHVNPEGGPLLVPDGSRVLFLRTKPSGDRDLYSAPSDGSGTPVALDGALGPSARLIDYQITPDGQRVVLEVEVDLRYSLHWVPVDGSAAPVLLHASESQFHGLTRPKISPDSARIAFKDEARLYTAPLDGSALASRIPADQVDSDFELVPEGSLIVYRRANGSRGLWVVPTDGSAAPRKLDEPLQFRDAVTSFALAPDGSRAVYLGDQAVDETFELYSVLLDGSAPPVRLHAALAEGRDVLSGFRISSDGQRVVYRADALLDEQLDLFAAPVDASQPPVRLNPGLVPGGDVLDFRITPDGQRVAYRADREQDERIELFSAALRGARSVRKLSRELVPGGDVHSFRISADSSTVAFTAERDAQGHATLLAAPMGGEEKAAELAGPFVEGGTVHEFDLSADGARVVYRADQEGPGVIELHSAPYHRTSMVKRR